MYTPNSLIIYCENMGMQGIYIFNRILEVLNLTSICTVITVFILHNDSYTLTYLVYKVSSFSPNYNYYYYLLLFFFFFFFGLHLCVFLLSD